MIEAELFHRALEKPTLAEQLAFLDQACADQPELRERVERLLRSHHQEDSFLEAGVTTDQPMTESLGTVIGPYKLLQQIGEGGMGTVFMAEQSEPVQRRVALKIVKPGMDSRQVIARFEAERQALAMMDHPNIAKVLDAGATAPTHSGYPGRPYFVMELVRGIPITKYCDEKHLTLKQRLELFVPICQAIQHAHQKGIIHRDLKPTNVLIAEYDNQPVAKVIDFGVAKAVAQRLTERTMFTEFGQVVGTLEYMSPEQAKLNQLDIDTRSDVYSLGVLLYELLTGSTPFDRKRLQSAAFDEMLRIIREEEPPRPSTRLSSTGTLPSIAANRNAEPGRLGRALRGELDWIVMKALEKDRNRRYETTSGLARDIERYLSDEPVQACPPSAVYRLHKFARRNKLALITGGLIGLSLVVGAVVSVWQAVRAMHAEQKAQAKQKLAEENFQKARDAVNKYFTLVSQDKLLDMPGLEPLRRDLLEAALRYYEGMLDRNEENPAVLADIAATHMRVSTIYHRLDRNDDALAAVDNALPIVERLMHDYADSDEYQRQLAGVFKFGELRGKTRLPKDPDAARRTLLRALELWTAMAKLNPSVEGFQSDIAALQYVLGSLEGTLGNTTGKTTAHAQAMEYLQKAAAILDALSTAHPEDRYYLQFAIEAYADLGWNARGAGNQVVPQQAYRRGQELEEAFVARFPDDLSLRSRRASQILKSGTGLVSKEPKMAEEQCRQALSEFEALTNAFPNVAEYQMELAGCYRGLFESLYYQNDLRVEEEILCARKAIEIYERLLQDFPERRQVFLQQQSHHYRYLAFRLSRIKDFAGARASFEKSSEIFRQCAENTNVGERATCFVGWAGNSVEIAALWAAEGRDKEAQQELREALKRFELLLTERLEKNITVGWINGFHSQLAQVLGKCGTPEDALRISHELHPPGPELNSAGSRGVGSCYAQIARILELAGRSSEAEAALRQSQEVVKEIVRRAEQSGKSTADSRLQAVRFDLEWSGLQEQAGLREQAYKSLRHAAELLEPQGNDAQVDDALRQEAAKVHSRLGHALKAQGKLEDAIECYRKAADLEPTSASAHIRFGQVLQAQRKLNEAVAAFRKAVELDPQSVEAWQYLGWVEYRAGNSKASIEALETSCKLQNPGDCGQWIVMALAHGKLAKEKELSEQERDWHKTEARRWYDLAVKQIDGQQGLNDEIGQAIRAFRAEAAELFDGKEQPK